jgi:hypothetical protein
MACRHIASEMQTDCEALLMVLGTHPFILQAPLLARFSVVLREYYQVSLTGWAEGHDEDSFVADFRYVASKVDASLVAFLSQTMPLKDVRVLFLHLHQYSWHPKPTMGDWQQLLNACPRMVNLHVGGGASLSLAILLGNPGMRETWDGTRLEKIVFEETDVQEQTAHDGRPLLEHLRDFALIRAESVPACTVVGFTRCVGLPTAQETKAQFCAFFDNIEILVE